LRSKKAEGREMTWKNKKTIHRLQRESSSVTIGIDEDGALGFMDGYDIIKISREDVPKLAEYIEKHFQKGVAAR
jgi:hypothetical protein